MQPVAEINRKGAIAMDPAEPQTVTTFVSSVGTSNGQTEPTTAATTEPTTTTEPMHTDAEAALMQQVQKLTAEIAKLRDENKKLFLRIGGGDEGQTSKSPDDEIRTMLQGFRESGYNPNKLYGGV